LNTTNFSSIMLSSFISQETAVGYDAEGTHLTLIKEGDYDIQTISMETICESP